MASGSILKFMDGTDTGWIENKGVDGDDKKFIGSIFYRRQGNIVFVRGYGIKSKTIISAGGSLELLTLPSNYRPVNSTGSSAMTNSGSLNGIRIFPVLIAGNGKLYVYANTDADIGTTVSINFNFIYSAN